MTFDWQKIISESLDPAPAIAFNATAIGAIALLFIWKGWWPLSTGEAITAPTAGMLVLWGGVCLVGRGTRVGYAKREARKEAQAERLAIAAREAALPAEIDRNMETLGQVEMAQLLWILTNGKQRVDEAVSYSLIEKHILVPVQPRNYHLVEVHPHVWAKREAILASLPRSFRPGGTLPLGR